MLLVSLKKQILILKLPDVSSLVAKSTLTVIKNKIPDISSLVKETVFSTKVTEIESKIPDVSSLVKKTDYATKIANIKNDYVTNVALIARQKDLIQRTKSDTEVKKLMIILLQIVQKC